MSRLCIKHLTTRGLLVVFMKAPGKGSPPTFCKKHPWVAETSRLSKGLVAKPLGAVTRLWYVNGEKRDTPPVKENYDAEDTETGL